MQYTTNYNLAKFEGTDKMESATRTNLNTNFDTLDSTIHTLATTNATQSASGLMSASDKTKLDGMDYIVEQDASDGIYYRKWNSGFLEIEGTASVSSTSSTASGNGYYTEALYISLPVSFVSCYGYLASSVGDSGIFATRYGALSSVTNQIGFRLNGVRTISTGSHSITFRAFGTWE